MENRYHFRANPSLKTASTTRKDQLRDDTADVEHRDAIGAEMSEKGLPEGEKDHTWENQSARVNEVPV